MAVGSLESLDHLTIGTMPQQPLALQLETHQLSTALCDFRMSLGDPLGTLPTQQLGILQNGHLQISESETTHPNFEACDVIEPAEIAPTILGSAAQPVAAAAIYHAGKWLMNNAPEAVASFSSAIPEYCSEEASTSLGILDDIEGFYQAVQTESQTFYGPRQKRGYWTQQEALVQFSCIADIHRTTWSNLLGKYEDLPDDHLVFDLATNDLGRASESLFDRTGTIDIEENGPMIDAMMKQYADMFRRQRVIYDLRRIIQTQATVLN